MRTKWTEECDTTARRASRTYFPNVSFVLLCNQQCLPHPALNPPPTLFPVPVFPIPFITHCVASEIFIYFYAHSLALALFRHLSRSFGRHNLLTEMENIFDRRSRGGGGEEGKRTRQTRAPILAKVKRAHTDRQEKRRRWGEGGK